MTEQTYEPGKGPWRYAVRYSNSFKKDIPWRKYRAGDLQRAKCDVELIKQHIGPAYIEEYGKRAR